MSGFFVGTLLLSSYYLCCMISLINRFLLPALFLVIGCAALVLVSGNLAHPYLHESPVEGILYRQFFAHFDKLSAALTSVLLNLSVALLVFRIVRKEQLTEEGGFIYLFQVFLLSFAVRDWAPSGPIHWALLLLLLALNMLIHVGNSERKGLLLFDVGVLFGIAALVFPPIWPAVVVVFLFAALITTLSFRLFLFYIAGVFTTVFVTVNFLLWQNEVIWKLEQELLPYLFYAPDFSGWNTEHAYLFWLATGISIMGMLIPFPMGTLVRSKRIHQGIIVMAVLSGISMLFTLEPSFRAMSIVAPWFGYLSARALETVKVWWITTTLLLIELGVFFLLYL